MSHAANQRGSALIETLFAAPIAAVVVGVGFYLMYLAFAQAWIERAAREAALCLVTRTTRTSLASSSRNGSITACRQRLESTLRAGLLLGPADIEVFRVGITRSRVQISLDTHTALISPDNAPTRLHAKSSFPRRL
jgi:hypothetical protein